MSPEDHYAVLGVDRDASRDEIEDAWRFHLKAFHPDRFQDTDHRGRAEEMSKRLNAAWQVLGDPAARRRYDRRRPSVSVNGAAAAAPARRPREIPCPTCMTISRVEDPGGKELLLRCPGCQDQFAAIVGASLVERPRLERRWWRIDYRMLLAADDGEGHIVSFRKLPRELSLADGMRISVVFRAGTDQPAYAIAHHGGVDMLFPVR